MKIKLILLFFFITMSLCSTVSAKIDSDYYAGLLKNQKAGPQQMLFLSAFGSDFDLFKEYIAKGADINARDKDGNTALILGAKSLDIVKYLVSKNVDINAGNNDGETALLMAAQSGNPEVVRFLIEHNADVNAASNDGTTALMRTCNREVFMLLLKNKADVNAKDKKGETALMKAYHLARVKVLIDHGADINAKDNENMTALMHFAKRRMFKEVELLIRHGANINIKDKTGKKYGDYKDTLAKDPSNDCTIVSVCATANSSLKNIATTMTQAGLNFKNINDLNSFCRGDRTILETMLVEGNHKALKKLLYYLKTRKGEWFVEELLNYPIPNRRNNKSHSLLDFNDYLYSLGDGHLEAQEYVNKLREFLIAYGAKNIADDCWDAR
jgi:ankyrin repeat protein